MPKTSGARPKWEELPLLLDYEIDTRWHNYTSVLYSSAMDALSAINIPTDQKIRQRLVNLLPEKRPGNKVALRQREFLRVKSTGFSKSATVTTPRGIFTIPSLKYGVEFWDTTLYVRTTDDTYTTTTSMGSATEGPGGCVSGIDSSGVAYGYAMTVSKSVIVKTTGNTAVSDGDYPASAIPTPVFLDSYIFVAALGSRKIYNSGVGDPTTWQASTYIETEEFGGNIVGLARHHKLVVALCEDHIEFFRDAGIPSPNSPLQRVPEYTVNIGCINRATITQDGDTVYFAGRDDGGNFGVFQIKDYKVTRISNPSIDYVLSLHGGSNNVFGSITSWSATGAGNAGFATMYTLPMHGKQYLFLVLSAGSQSVAGGYLLARVPSFVYDPEFKIWIEIANAVKNTGAATNNYNAMGWAFPYGCNTFLTGTVGAVTKTALQNAFGGTDNNNIAAFDSVTQSGDVVVGTSGSGGFVNETPSTILLIQWPIMDMGTAGYKALSGLRIVDSAFSNSVLTANNHIIPQFARYGTYVAGGDSTGPDDIMYLNARSVGLNGYAHTVNEVMGRVYKIQGVFGSFLANWFALQLAHMQWRCIESVSIRIMPDEEA